MRTTTICAIPGPHQVVGGDQDLLGDALVVRQQKGDTGLDLHAPHNVLERALEHLDHGRLTPATPVQTGDPSHDTVAMPESAHLARAQEQVIAALVRAHEPEAVRMSDDAPMDQVLVIDHAVAAAPVAHDLAIACHRVHTPRQRIQLLRFDKLECLGQIIELQRGPVFLHQAQDEFAAGDRIFVLLGLAGLVRVAIATASPWFTC